DFVRAEIGIVGAFGIDRAMRDAGVDTVAVERHRTGKCVQTSAVGRSAVGGDRIARQDVSEKLRAGFERCRGADLPYDVVTGLRPVDGLYLRIRSSGQRTADLEDEDRIEVAQKIEGQRSGDPG